MILMFTFQLSHGYQVAAAAAKSLRSGVPLPSLDMKLGIGKLTSTHNKFKNNQAKSEKQIKKGYLSKHVLNLKILN